MPPQLDHNKIPQHLKIAYDIQAEHTRRALNGLKAMGFTGDLETLPPIPNTKFCPRELTDIGIYIPVTKWRNFVGNLKIPKSLAINVIGMPGTGKTTAINNFGEMVGRHYLFTESYHYARELAQYGELAMMLYDENEFASLAELLEMMHELEKKYPGKIKKTDKPDLDFASMELLKVRAEVDMLTLRRQIVDGDIENDIIIADRTGLVDDGIFRTAELMTNVEVNPNNLKGMGGFDKTSVNGFRNYISDLSLLIKEGFIDSFVIFMASPEVSLRRRPTNGRSGEVFRRHMFEQYLTFYYELLGLIKTGQMTAGLAIINTDKGFEDSFEQFERAIIYTRTICGYPPLGVTTYNKPYNKES